MTYNNYAKYYDLLMGDPSGKVSMIKSWIKKYNPKSKTILEIACGTGSILKHLENDYITFGLDLSKDMIKIAKSKLHKTNLRQADMTIFSYNRKFDVILCIYDSINQLPNFKDWEKTFKNVAQHLDKGSLFIFDVNTPLTFVKFSVLSPEYVSHFGKDIIIHKNSVSGKNKVLFNKIIFQHKNGNKYESFEETITELVFPKEKIILSLDRHFKVLKIVDPKQKNTSNKSKRLYFICRVK